MTDTVGVVVATFGDRGKWTRLARRALETAKNQSRPADAVMWWHGDSLMQARHKGAGAVGTDWLIFLDADDELDPYYIERMLEAEGDIRRPSTLGFYPDGSQDEEPCLIPSRPDGLDTGNYIVIGAMVRSEAFWGVGGFNDYPILEDWDLWRRMVAEGATVGEAPGAIYRVGVRPGSRNSDAKLHARVYTEIRSK